MGWMTPVCSHLCVCVCVFKAEESAHWGNVSRFQSCVSFLDKDFLFLVCVSSLYSFKKCMFAIMRKVTFSSVWFSSISLTFTCTMRCKGAMLEGGITWCNKILPRVLCFIYFISCVCSCRTCHMYVEVWGQEWDWVLSFSLVKSWSFLFLLHCVLQASWPLSSWTTVLSPHIFRTGVLGLQKCGITYGFLGCSSGHQDW